MLKDALNFTRTIYVCTVYLYESMDGGWVGWMVMSYMQIRKENNIRI